MNSGTSSSLRRAAQRKRAAAGPTAGCVASAVSGKVTSTSSVAYATIGSSGEEDVSASASGGEENDSADEDDGIKGPAASVKIPTGTAHDVVPVLPVPVQPAPAVLVVQQAAAAVPLAVPVVPVQPAPGPTLVQQAAPAVVLTAAAGLGVQLPLAAGPAGPAGAGAGAQTPERIVVADTKAARELIFTAIQDDEDLLFKVRSLFFRRKEVGVATKVDYESIAGTRRGPV